MKSQSNADLIVIGLLVRLNRLNGQLMVLEAETNPSLEDIAVVKGEFDRMEQLLALVTG